MIALLQLDPTVGAFQDNRKRVEKALDLLAPEEVDLAVTPELMIHGYPPRDRLNRPDFIKKGIEEIKTIGRQIPMLIGSALLPEGSRRKPSNGVYLCMSGALPRIVARKQLLPAYDVFDESRYFESGRSPGIIRIKNGVSIAITVCEDAWQCAGEVPSDYDLDPIEQISEMIAGRETLAATVNLSASPYHLRKSATRFGVARAAAASLGHPFLVANQVGGMDDLVFDGRSMVAWPDGHIVMAPAWEEGIFLVDLDDPTACKWIPLDTTTSTQSSPLLTRPNENPKLPSDARDLLDAVSIGLSDYVEKSGIERVVLGLSGGIDSAVVAALASRALGPDAVCALAMPSRHSSAHSIEDAIEVANALGIELLQRGIKEMHQATEFVIQDELKMGHNVAAENIQARLRAVLLMGIANARGGMLLATGNKSELAVGYCTLYGDMAGGYAPIGDLYKTEVYDIAHVLNQEALEKENIPPIHSHILDKSPSAELAPNQIDEDSLPPYTILDQILSLHIEKGMSLESIIAAKIASPDVIIDVLAEHKRWQMPPAPRVSERAFGQGWRQPLAAKHTQTE